MGYLEIVSEASGYWPLQELSGTTAVDASGNGHDGMLNNLSFEANKTDGPTSWLPSALRAPGITGHSVSVPNHPDLQGGNQVSLVSWVRSSGSGPGSSMWPITKGQDFNVKDYSLEHRYPDHSTYPNTSGFYSEGYGEDYILSASQPTDWYHLAATYNNLSGECRVYVNGILKSSDTSTGHSVATSSDVTFFVFPYSLSRQTSGDIAGVGMWNRILTQHEVRHLYHGPLPDSESTIGMVDVEGSLAGQVFAGSGAVAGLIHS